MTDARPPAMFIADALGLDFLNSVSVPLDVPVEYLASGEDLIAWLRQAGLVPASVLDETLANAGPGELDAVAAQARALREWFRGFVREHRGRRLDAQAVAGLEPLNRLLARDEGYGQICAAADPAAVDDSITGLQWAPMRRWRSPDALLLPIAQAMAELLTSADFSQVKACEGPACTLLFLDRTRGHKRRWCNMAVCGNRAKQAAHRERHAQRS
ncbi:CGNR zinc finger domain-containing protein [Rhizobacter sp. P5_C2]